MWKTVWITGASSGIGYELAQLMADKANHVAVSARSTEKLETLQAAHSNIFCYPLDVTDQVATVASVNEITAQTGTIDLAILNAASWQLIDVTSFDPAAIRYGMDVNYMGVVNGVHAVLPQMLNDGKGHIAIVASTAGYRGLPRSGAYGPTKAALINLTETLRCELEPLGITISLVCPGFVDTPATRTNPFPMPGMITASAAAQAIISGLERRKYDVSFPWLFVFFMKLLRMVPNGIYFWLIRTFVWKQSASNRGL